MYDDRIIVQAVGLGFSALQRAEIAEILCALRTVLRSIRFSALQRAEIAEMKWVVEYGIVTVVFQCSSTSRNC